jgi:hypothetical protein
MTIVPIYLSMHKFINVNRWMYFISTQLHVYENYKILT